MASKPTVTLTLAGDEKKLTEAFDRVGAASKAMGDKVSSTKGDFDSVGRSTDNFVDKADGAESKAIGFTDTLSGLQGAMQGLTDPTLSTGERLAVLGQAAADLAGGFANLVIPALGKMGSALLASSAGQWVLNAAQSTGTVITGALTTAFGALNTVMRANPILTVITIIGLLVGAFILLWNKSEGFRNFFIGMWNGIKTVVGKVVDWIKGAWNGVVDFFSKLPGRITGFFRGLGEGIKNIFKGAVNVLIDLLNGGIGLINGLLHGINNVSGLLGIPAIPDIPKIPRLHTGGVVDGMPGTEQLRVLQAGERVTTSSQAGSGGRLVISAGADSALASFLMSLERKGIIRWQGA